MFRTLLLGGLLIAFDSSPIDANERVLIAETSDMRLYSNHDIERKPGKLEDIADTELASDPIRFSSARNPARGLPERALPGQWEGFGGVPFGCNGLVFDIERGPDGKIYFGGDFVACNDVVVNNVAAWDPSTNEFEALGSPPGRFSPVYDLEFLPNGDLVESGFNSGPHVWDGAQWQRLGDVNFNIGPNRALAVDPATGDIYLGGPFTQAFPPSGGTLPLSGVARWDGSSWTALGDGLSGGVRTLEWADGMLYAGGDFTASGATPLNRVAAWDGTDWSDLGGGVDDTVNALVHDGSRLYAGGRFDTAGGVVTESVAVWDGSNWSSIDGPVCCVEDLHFDGGLLYVAGGFSSVNGLPTGRVAIWDGSQWSGAPVSAISDGGIRAIHADVDGIFAGGSFSVLGTFALSDFPVNGLHASRIVRFDPDIQQWSALGNGSGDNLNGSVTDMVAFGGELWVSGSFRFAGTRPMPEGLARWTGTEWVSPPQESLPCGEFQQLSVSSSGVLFAETTCLASGSTIWGGTARLAGNQWVPVGQGFSGSVFGVSADQVDDQILYFGRFTETNDTPALAVNRIARWNGSSWETVGTGAENGVGSTVSSFPSVSGVAANDGQAMLWGNFDRAGTVEVDRLAFWDGANWSSPGGGLSRFGGSPSVRDIEFRAGSYFATGLFDASGSQNLRSIASWSGSAWLPLQGPVGEGLGGFGSALHSSNGRLYVGGSFSEAGGRPANNIAVWNGGDWKSLGSGLSNGLEYGSIFSTIETVVEIDGVIYIGGEFVGNDAEASPNLIRFVLADLIHRDRFEQ
jgi:hypothetical protein